MTTRCISIQGQLEFETNGSILSSQTILVEDINDDNENEIIVGTSFNDIIVYKGINYKPWLKTNLKQASSICCMCFGDVTNQSKNFLIVFDVIGNLYLFHTGQIRKRYASEISPIKRNQNEYKIELRQIFQQKLIPNLKMSLVGSLIAYELTDLFLLTNDNNIYMYSWEKRSQTNSYSSSIGSINSLKFQETGCFVLKKIWNHDFEVHSINIFKDLKAQMEIPHLLVTQSNCIIRECVYENLKEKDGLKITKEIMNFSKHVNYSNEALYFITNVLYGDCNHYAYLVTLSGCVFFVYMHELLYQDKPIWQRQLNTKINQCFKIMLEDNSNESLIVSNLNGQVLIVNCQGDILSIDLGEPIRVFSIGNYTLEPSSSNNSPNIESTVELLDMNLLKTKFSCNNLTDSAFLNEQSSTINKNKPCLIFASTLTNQLCVVPFEFLIKNSLYNNNTSRLKTKCTNTCMNEMDKTKTRRLLYGDNHDDVLDENSMR